MYKFDSASATTDLLGSPGIHVIEGFVPSVTCDHLCEIALQYEPDRFGTVRGLLDKSTSFEDILLNDSIDETCKRLFGVPHRLGSMDIKISPPASECSGSFDLKPHIDFPGGIAIGTDEGAQSRYYGLPLALKVFIPLSDLTLEAGATAYIPGSHLWQRDPARHPLEFEKRMEVGETRRLIVPRGSLAMWSGPLWHADLENRSPRPRFLMHICMTPFFAIRPHALDRLYPESFMKQCPMKMRALIA